jgi:hypothetical protein
MENELKIPDFAEETILRVASLLANGLSDQVICATLLLEQEQLDAIRETDECKLARAEQETTILQRRMDSANNWDRIERNATQRVAQVVESYACDPRYALAAARVANTARRPMQSDSAMLEAGSINQVVVINLPPAVTAQLQAAPVTLAQSLNRLPKKVSSLPSPGEVTKLLNQAKPEDAPDFELSIGEFYETLDE